MKHLKIINQSTLNNTILRLYHDVKELRSFDNGYVNAPPISHYTTSSDNNNHSKNIKCEKMMKQFVKAKKDDKLPVFFKKLELPNDIVNDLQQIIAESLYNVEDDDAFDYFLYQMVLILRNHDGHTYDTKTHKESDNDEKNEYYDKDYPLIIELTNTLTDKNPNIFLQKILEIISHPGINYFYTIHGDIGDTTYFLFLYKILLHSIYNYHESLMFSYIMNNKIRLPKTENDILVSNLLDIPIYASRNFKF